MQQCYQQVCERRDQAARRNQALLRDARQAYTSALAAAVDTSKLEALKREYQLSVASRYQQWLAHRTHSQNGGLATSTTDLSLPLTKCLPANDTVKETTGACAALYSPAVAYSATLPQPGEAKLSVPPVPSQQCPSSKPVASLRAGENSPPTPAEETPFTATENTPFTENAPFTATENTLLTATKNTLFTEKTPATKKTQLTATEKTPATENTPFTATENKPLVASEKSSHQTHSSLGTPHQTQSLAVQSLQGSECTLLSPTHSHTPTGKTRERSGYDTSAIMTSNTLENQTLPLTSKQGHSHTFQATLTELHSVGQSSSSGDDGFTESQGLLHQSVHVRRDSEENESSQEQVGKTSGSVSGLSRGTVGETKATDSTPPGQISGGKGDKKPPSDMSSSDGGGGESPPLPRDTVSQRESGESSKESDGSSTSADSGDGLEHSTAHVGIDKSKSHQERAQTTEQTTDKVQSDKDAYASFLLSVRQTAAMTAAPLLDSDSEGVEDEVAGHQSRVSDESSASISPGRAAGSEVPQAKSQFEGEERESLELDASVSDSLPSPHKSSYIPSAMERKHSAESKTLQKRLGFWGSDSSLESSQIEAPPSAEDDQGDFDFYM